VTVTPASQSHAWQFNVSVPKRSVCTVDQETRQVRVYTERWFYPGEGIDCAGTAMYTIVCSRRMHRPLPPPPCLEIVRAAVTAAAVEAQCQGEVVIRNSGGSWLCPPDRLGFSYGITIHEEAGAGPLFRTFGGLPNAIATGEEVRVSWDTHSNHLGETSEPPFLIPAPGTYRLTVFLYRDSREQRPVPQPVSRRRTRLASKPQGWSIYEKRSSASGRSR
jgi:hypothetical protein